MHYIIMHMGHTILCDKNITQNCAFFHAAHNWKQGVTQETDA